ncbi:MAG: hypothetical protein NT031_10910, partial [Planctomycetota bacterium]|nr:hypothetical protein [Planctomycetota bacterium]
MTVTLAARFINLAMGVLTQSVLAWCLGPGDRGSYAACIVFATVLSTIFLFGLDMAGHYYTASKNLSAAEGVSTTLALTAAGALLAALIGLGAMRCPLPLLESFFQKSTTTSFLLALGMILPMSLNFCISQLLVAFKSFLRVAILTFVMAILQLLAILAMVWQFHWGVNGAMGASLTSSG